MPPASTPPSHPGRPQGTPGSAPFDASRSHFPTFHSAAPPRRAGAWELADLRSRCCSAGFKSLFPFQTHYGLRRTPLCHRQRHFYTLQDASPSPLMVMRAPLCQGLSARGLLAPHTRTLLSQTNTRRRSPRPTRGSRPARLTSRAQPRTEYRTHTHRSLSSCTLPVPPE